MLTLNGDPIPALDHVTIADGKLVLQKDGSIVPLPVVSTMGMSDGTRVAGNGLITLSNGEQFMLSEGQRLTVEGAVMTDPTMNEGRAFRPPFPRVIGAYNR